MKHVDLDRVYAPVPGSGRGRFILATADPDNDCFSSTDFETAYLQADHWEEDVWVLLVYCDPETDQQVFVCCTGPLYGQQELGYDWGLTRTDRLCRKMGFAQCINMPSIYFHKERKIEVPVNVDDPFAVCKTKAGELWFH